VPGNAVAVPRRHFDPREGWFRRIERQANRFLSRRVFPHVPGIRYPYTFILDRHLECSEAEVSLDGLGRELDGASILLVSDIHAGPFLDPEALGRALGRAAATHPDLILLGGDFATTRLGELEPCLPAFSRLRAPLGVWAVLGNHDHYTEDAHRIREMLEAAGIRVLHNDAACIERDGSKVVLVGIDDLHWGRVDLEGALESGRKLATDCPVILLSHNPDVFFSAAKMGVGLVLA
jgi:predicted MPP superfamily phosphohydrolase